MKAKEELAKKNQEILQLHSLLSETEQLLVGVPYIIQYTHDGGAIAKWLFVNFVKERWKCVHFI